MSGRVGDPWVDPWNRTGLNQYTTEQLTAEIERRADAERKTAQYRTLLENLEKPGVLIRFEWPTDDPRSLNFDSRNEVGQAILLGVRGGLQYAIKILLSAEPAPVEFPYDTEPGA